MGHLIKIYAVCRFSYFRFWYLELSVVVVVVEGWSGGAMVLGKLPVPGRPTTLITVGQGPTALAVGAGEIFFFFYILTFYFFPFLPLFGRRPDID